MSTSVTVSVRTSLAAVKTFSGADSGNPDISFTSGNPSGDVYTAATTIPVSKESKFTATMSGGVLTIDLTALTSDAEPTIDATGLRVQFLRLASPSTNANKIVVSQGGSNPYRLDAATATWSIPMAVGQIVQLELGNAGDVVGGSNKTILLTGTAAQTLSVHIVMG